MTDTLTQEFARWLPRIEAEMKAAVTTSPTSAPLPAALSIMLRYHLGFANADGSEAQIYAGKRIRPLLLLLSAQAAGGDPAQALPAAAAVELLHNFSLIHDDIEDGDETRRGRPTLWKLWGVPQAINTGDTMFAMAHQALLRNTASGVPAERMLRALEIFERTNVHLTIGQHLDIGFERRGDVSSADYLAMIAGKTGALTVACCEIGAVLGGGSDAHIHAAGEFGRYLGLAFQLQDDVLGVWGDAALTGKDSSDIAHRKKTLPLLYAAEQDARVRTLYFAPEALNSDQIQTLRAYVDATDARAHTEAAAAAAFAQGIEALDELPESAARTLLQTLAESLLGRSH